MRARELYPILFRPRSRGLGNALWDAAGAAPSLDLRLSGGSLIDVITGNAASITRASTATYRDAAGLIQTAAINEARFETDPATGKTGLLVEPVGATNLLLNTATLSTQSVTTVASPYTLHFTGTGTVTLTGASTAGPLVGTGTGEANRVSLTFTPTAGSLTLTVSGTVTNAMLELGTSRSSYMPSAGVTGVRAAEVLTLPANFNSALDTYSEGYDYQGGYLLTRLAQWGGTGQAWTPTALPGLAGWYDATDASSFALTGSEIDQWSDKSGVGNHLTSTSAERPTRIASGINGLPSVLFDGINDVIGRALPSGGIGPFSDFNYAVVVEMLSTTGNWQTFVGMRSGPSGDSTGTLVLQRMGTDNQVGCHNTDFADTRIAVNQVLTAPMICTLGRAGGSVAANGGIVHVSSTTAIANAFTEGTQTWDSNPNGTYLQVGGRQQIGTTRLNGRIGEVIVSNRRWTNDELQRVQGYLAHKWGMTGGLAATHPYKFAPPVN